MIKLIDKELYREFCKVEDNIPIFSKDWWMDAVCGEDKWDVILIKNENDVIIASMPYYIRNKFGVKIITQPPLTQTNGVYIKYPEGQKLCSRISYEKDIIYEIDEKLKELKIDYYNQNFHYTFTNWQPFYWKGYSQTTRYTYILKDLSNLDKVYGNFNKSKRKYIKQNEKIYKVYKTEDIKTFYALNTKVFKRQNLKIPYSLNLIEKLDKILLEKKSRVIFAIDDKNGDTICMLYLVFDNKSSYLLMSGTDPDTRDFNVKTLLVWEAIKFSSQKKLIFDFEGSMVENIATFFKEFGAEPTPYFNISKTFFMKGKVSNLVKPIYHGFKKLGK